MNKEKMQVGLTYDLRQAYLDAGYSELETAEFDSADTIAAIESALTGQGYAVERVGNVKQLAGRLANGDRWDIVFNICEGMHGTAREAQVPALLDAYDIPYVFSDALVCALTLHKGMTKDVVSAAGIATPAYVMVHKPTDVRHLSLEFPLFAKPVAEGTGKGISANSKISSLSELRKVCGELLKQHNQPVIVERFLPGREFTVGVLGTDHRASALATLEIALLDGADSDVYSYKNKENCESLVHYSMLPAGKLRSKIEALALQAWRKLGCRDAGRVDVRLDEAGQVGFLEVNALAGLHPDHSDLPIMAKLAGVTYDELIGRIMASAIARLGKVRRAASMAA